jgi:hypothetical protein
VVEKEATIKGIKMSRGVEPIFIIRQEIVVLPSVEPIITEVVFVAIRIRYSEPKIN